MSSSTPCADFFFRRGPCPDQKKAAVVVAAAWGQYAAAPGSVADDNLAVVKKCSEVELDLIVLWKVCVCVCVCSEHSYAALAL